MLLQRLTLPGAAVGALIVLTACTSWQVAPVPPAQFLAEHHERALVELRDGSVHELAEPAVVGDSLTGLIEGSAEPGQPLARATYALPDVARVASPTRDAAKTAGIVVGPPAFVLLGLFVMSE
jgi:hypothetical protein